MENKFGYVLLFVLTAFISSVSQIMLKKSSMREYASKIKEYVNFKVIVAYALFFGCTLVTVFAYKFVPISVGTIMESSGYIFVMTLGYFWLKERVTINKIFGLILILTGIVVFNIK